MLRIKIKKNAYLLRHNKIDRIKMRRPRKITNGRNILTVEVKTEKRKRK